MTNVLVEENLEMKGAMRASDLDRFLAANPNLAKRAKERQPLVALAVMLLELRAKLGMTQEELAHRAGLTPSQLSEYENAANEGIALRTMKRIAQAVGASLKICYDLRRSEIAGQVQFHILRPDSDYVTGEFVVARKLPPSAGLAA